MRSGQNPSTGANPLCRVTTGGGGLVTIARTTGFTWFPAIGSQTHARTIKVNFGQDSTFSGGTFQQVTLMKTKFGDFKYSNKRFQQCVLRNLPIRSNVDPAETDDDHPQNQFGVITYTGTGTSGTKSEKVGFPTRFIWTKEIKWYK